MSHCISEIGAHPLPAPLLGIVSSVTCLVEWSVMFPYQWQGIRLEHLLSSEIC